MAVIGIDVGGTGSRYVLLDDDGEVLESGGLRWRYGGDLNDLSSEIRDLKKGKGALKVGVAMRGVWGEGERERVRGQLGVDVVMSDVEGAFYDAFRDEGMVVVAGTGSICYGRRGDRVSRFGGFGPLIDDWGSGFWMGRLAVEIALKKESFLRLALFGTEDLNEIRNVLADLQRRPFPEMVREVARYSEVVVRAAEMGEEDASFVVKSALRELLGMCLWVREDLGNVRSIALHGGLFRSSFFRKHFLSLLRRYAFNRIVENTDAAKGVGRWLLREG